MKTKTEMLCPEGHVVNKYRNRIPTFSTWLLYKLGMLALKFEWPSQICVAFNVEGDEYYVMSCKKCRRLYFDYQCTSREVDNVICK